MRRSFCSVDVDEAQRSHAISANANFVIPDDDVPAVRLELENGEEFATVVEVLEAAWSRRLMLSTAHDVTAFGTRREMTKPRQLRPS